MRLPRLYPKVNLMRFSSIFQLPLTPRLPAMEPTPLQVQAPVVALAAAMPPPAGDLPEALDERVRLVGEWQLGDI
jgi:hypothetical protein